jgi:formylglycine-generating enzyme required for sulfatase activity
MLAVEAKARFLREVQSGELGSKLDVPLSGSYSAPFCFITSGSFTMGSPLSEVGRNSDEGQVEVTLSQSFWLAKTEVTQAQWEAVMGSNPSWDKATQLPMEVSWDDAQTFITKLNEKRILPIGWKFALPTEAQWEYACRAGEKGPYSGGSLDEVGWHEGNSDWDGDHQVRGVGLKEPNAWGLCDMHGNVREWCADWYAEALQGGVDPRGPDSGDERVVHGSYYWDSKFRAAERDGFKQDMDGSSYAIGFRPAIVKAQ